MQPRVSIIITCYNLGNYINDAIQSLLNQNCGFDFEIIVIDDASTDNSKNIINSITDSRIKKYFLPENVGAAQAINQGFSHAKGEYICRFDADDKWYPDYLQKAVNALDKNQTAALVHTDVTLIDQNNVLTSLSNNIDRPKKLLSLDYEFESILEKYYINAPTIMGRRESWLKYLPWDERFRKGMGDWYYSLLMLENNPSYFIDEPLAYYRIHNSNMHRSMVTDKTAEKNMLFILDFFSKRLNEISSKKRRKIYYEWNKRLGLAYFSNDMKQDAKRCFKRAFKNNVTSIISDAEFAKIWFGTMIGKKTYEKAKSFLRYTKNRQKRNISNSQV